MQNKKLQQLKNQFKDQQNQIYEYLIFSLQISNFTEEEKRKGIIIALFKEFLVLNDLQESRKCLLKELQDKQIKFPQISKRSELLEFLDIKDVFTTEFQKNNKITSLDVLVQQYQLLLKQKANQSQPQQNIQQQQQTIQDNLSQSQHKHKTKHRSLHTSTQINNTEQTKQQTDNQKQLQQPKQQAQEDNIWNMKSVEFNQVSIQQKVDNSSLRTYLNTTCTYQLFNQCLFHDKNKHQIPETWYQNFACLQPQQHIDFNNDKTYLMKQLNGGPCSVIASLTARAYTFMKFYRQQFIQLQNEYQTAMLNSIIYTFSIIQSQQLILVLPKNIQDLHTLDEEDYFYVKYVTLKDIIQILSQQQYLDWLFTNCKASNALPCIVLSFILSRGIKTILKEDFDEQNDNQMASGSLFAKYNNCSQEMTNLLIHGRAVGNLNDDILDFGGMKLKGINSKTDIGLVIGNRLKVPTYPVWVCYNEAHYTALLCDNSEILSVIQQNINKQQVKGTVIFKYFDGLESLKDQFIVQVQYDSTKYQKRERESFLENLICTLVPAVDFKWLSKEKIL